MARAESRIVLALLMGAAVGWAQPQPWQAFPVLPGSGPQEHPQTYGSWVVWQEFNRARGDYDVVVADAAAAKQRRLFRADDPNDQMFPSLWDTRLVWQEFAGARVSGGDWDIYLAELGDASAAPRIYPVSTTHDYDEQIPVIHGNTVVWEDRVLGGESDIFGADITVLGDVRVFPIAVFDGNQTAPVLWRDQVLWQDDFSGDWDIYLSDIWLKDWVTEQPLAVLAGNQVLPRIATGIAVWQDDTFGDWDIVGADLTDWDEVHFIDLGRPGDQINASVYGGRVVWQDNRHGNWDIFLSTIDGGNEVRLTTNSRDQINPILYGDLVVWQDSRDGDWAVYGMWLATPPSVAPTPQDPGRDWAAGD